MKGYFVSIIRIEILTISNNYYWVRYSSDSGRMLGVKIHDSLITNMLQIQGFEWYNSLIEDNLIVKRV